MKNVKCKILVSLILLFASPAYLFSQHSAQDKFDPVYATVLKHKINIRAGCGLNFEILGQLNKTDEIVVIGQEYGWYKIKLPQEASCFVHKNYINEGIVNANKLRVRAGRGLNYNVLGILKKGQLVDILEEDGDWLRIVPPENCTGWIKKDYLKLSKKEFIPPVSSPKPAPILKPSSPEKRIEARGTIDDLGKIYNRPGTHKLIKGKKILYYLKSENINLNHYVYQKVCVIGQVFDAENFPYPVIDVEQIK